MQNKWDTTANEGNLLFNCSSFITFLTCFTLTCLRSLITATRNCTALTGWRSILPCAIRSDVLGLQAISNLLLHCNALCKAFINQSVVSLCLNRLRGYFGLTQVFRRRKMQIYSCFPFTMKRPINTAKRREILRDDVLRILYWR